MDYIYSVKLENGIKLEVRAADSLDLNLHDQCVFRRTFYQDMGTIIRKYREATDNEDPDMPVAIRKATMHDLSSATENNMRSKNALRTTQNYVDTLKLEMKLLNAHYSLDGKQLMIQFTADGRVDFRELVKELSQALNTRIELRQIGVRDESAIYGGIFICGQELCCSRFLKNFDSINVKMAKEQDLSLTPSNISGVCGRLKCCLKFEHDGYLELEKTMPRRGDCCECKEGRGVIIDRNLLTQKVVVQIDGTGQNVTCSKDEVTVVYPDKYKIRRQTPSAEEEAAMLLEDKEPGQEKNSRKNHNKK